MNKVYNNKRWRKLRLLVLNRDDWTCAYCGSPADTVDHVQPLADGGLEYSEHNLVAACKRCNSAKRDRVGFLARKEHPRPPFSFFSPDRTSQSQSPFRNPDSL